MNRFVLKHVHAFYKKNEIFGKKIEGDWNIYSKAVALIFVSVTDASESL